MYISISIYKCIYIYIYGWKLSVWEIFINSVIFDSFCGELPSLWAIQKNNKKNLVDN